MRQAVIRLATRDEMNAFLSGQFLGDLQQLGALSLGGGGPGMGGAFDGPFKPLRRCAHHAGTFVACRCVSAYLRICVSNLVAC